MIKEDCEKNQLNIKSFLKDELKGLKLRQFLVHIKNCSYCYDELLDEFIADTVFRDSDTVDNKNMSFNFKKELDKKIENYTNIVTGSDTKKIVIYRMISVFICLFAILLMAILLKFVFI